MSKTRTIREQCVYVAEFMVDAWDSGILDPPDVNWGSKGKPEKPLAGEELEKYVLSGTFPGFKLLELDRWEWMADVWFEAGRLKELQDKKIAQP